MLRVHHTHWCRSPFASTVSKALKPGSPTAFPSPVSSTVTAWVMYRDKRPGYESDLILNFHNYVIQFDEVLRIH